jgi:hypothetical protein
MRNISGKICRENQNTFYIQKFSLKIVLLIKVEEIIQAGTPQKRCNLHAR